MLILVRNIKTITEGSNYDEKTFQQITIIDFLFNLKCKIIIIIIYFAVQSAIIIARFQNIHMRILSLSNIFNTF